jgi:uncharacterized membrane protein YkvI
MPTIGPIRSALTILAAMIGAGFMTGVEIRYFYSQYKEWSFLMIMIGTVWMGWIFHQIMSSSHLPTNGCWQQFNNQLFPVNISRWLNPLLRFQWMLVGIIALSSGSELIHSQYDKIPIAVISFLLLTITVWIVHRGILRIATWSSMISACAIVFFVISMFHLIDLHSARMDVYSFDWLPKWSDPFDESANSLFQIIWNPLLYTGLNAAFALGIAIPLATQMKNPRDRISTSWMTAIAFGMLLIFLNSAILVFPTTHTKLDWPLWQLYHQQGTGWSTAYQWIMYGEIFSTLFASTYSNMNRSNEQSKIRQRSMLLFMYVISLFPVNQLVPIIYPVCGAICLLWLGAILIQFVISPIKSRKPDDT